MDFPPLSCLLFPTAYFITFERLELRYGYKDDLRTLPRMVMGYGYLHPPLALPPSLGCNSIDIWNLRLELRRKLRQGLRTHFLIVG